MVQGTPTARDRSTFRNFVRDCPDYDVRLTEHAREQMAKRRIELPQIERVLRTGSLTMVEPDIRTGQNKHRVEGRDQAERDLTVVVALGPGCQVTVITAF